MRLERIKQKLSLDEAFDLAKKLIGNREIFEVTFSLKDYNKILLESRIDGFRVYETVEDLRVG